MKYEIINPSDPYTLEAPSLAVAAFVVTLLGNGNYALEPEDSTQPGVPILMFGSFDKWWDKNIKIDAETFLDDPERKSQVIDCFRSVKLSNNNNEPSSLNNIGEVAQAFADGLSG